MINIKEQIGKRILEARKLKGLTRNGLAELTEDLKASRINNWERGIRTPGPEEIKQLARALDVAPAFLMCLTDIKKTDNQTPIALVPLLDFKQACEHLIYTSGPNDNSHIDYVAVNRTLLPSVSQQAFALKMKNESMIPEMRPNDILIIDPATSPSPGDFVGIKIPEEIEIIICQYRKLSYKSNECEFVTLNNNWPNIKDNYLQVNIIGKVVQNLRSY